MSKILVIEDQEVMRENIKELLEQKEFLVETANDAGFGLELTNSFMPDLILCDLKLPDYSGIDFIKRIKKNEQLKDIPVIIITGQNQQETYRNSMTQGADDFILKPFKAEELFDAVNAQLNKAKIRKHDLTIIAELSEQSPLPILRIDTLGRIIYSNPAANFLKEKQLIAQIRKLIDSKEDESFEFEFSAGEKIFNCLGSYNVARKYRNLYFIDNTTQKSLYRELKNKNSLIERKNQNLSKFNYIVAHDLKAPIITLRQLLDILLQDLHKNPPAKNKMIDVLMNLLNESLSKLETVMEDVSVILKAREDSYAHEKVVFSVANHVRKTVDKFNKELQNIQAEVNFCIDKNIQLNFSLSDFSIIIFNLIENAIKFSDPKRPLKIDFMASETHEEVILKIKDNGLGFDEKAANGKLFVLYQKMHSEIKGKGLGLQIVRNILDSHNGDIHFMSKPGLGTVFQLNFKK